MLRNHCQPLAPGVIDPYECPVTAFSAAGRLDKTGLYEGLFNRTWMNGPETAHGTATVSGAEKRIGDSIIGRSSDNMPSSDAFSR